MLLLLNKNVKKLQRCFFVVVFFPSDEEGRRTPTLFVYFHENDSLSRHSDIFALLPMRCMISDFNIVLLHVRGPFVKL